MDQNITRDTTQPVSFPPLWIGYLTGLVFTAFGITVGFIWPEGVPEKDIPAAEAVFILISLTGYIYWLVCVNRIHKVLDKVTKGTYPIKSGRAVGFHFLPFYNMYWIFKWPSEVVNFINVNLKGRKRRPYAPGIILLAALLIYRIIDGGIGIIIMFLVLRGIMRDIKKAVEESPAAASA